MLLLKWLVYFLIARVSECHYFQYYFSYHPAAEAFGVQMQITMRTPNRFGTFYQIYCSTVKLLRHNAFCGVKKNTIKG